MNRTKSRYRVLVNVLFVVYILALFYVVFGLDRAEQSQYRYNLVLFYEIRRFIKYRHLLGNTAFILNLLGNVGVFVPFGFLLPIVNRKYKNLFFIVLISFELSLFIELTQLIFKIGIFDVDDMFLNTIGGFLGGLLYYIIFRRKRRGRKK